MNWPKLSVYDEIEWIGKNNFDFIDLTLEPPGADPDKVNINKIKSLLKRYDLGIVGHTAWYPRTNSPIKESRQAALRYFLKCLKCFAKLKAKTMTVHAVRGIGEFGLDKQAEFFAEVLNPLCKTAKSYNMHIVLENVQEENNLELVEKIMKKVPLLKFHLDIGHSNLSEGNIIEDYLKKFSKKLMHVHVSDNLGYEDQHLPLGVGNIDWPEMIRLLKKYHYNHTITIEVFSPDTDYRLISRNKLKKLWDEA